MSPTPRLWDDIVAPHRSGDLQECVRSTRAAVDAQPYELPPRYLLAALYVALGEPGLALLQYERLLPLAVGRGELFLALAAQRRLDELHPQATPHARRYHAMHQWFLSLSRSERKRKAAAPEGAFGPQVLVRLTSSDFAAVAEECRVETLPIDPRTLTADSGLLWVVLHGRVSWALLDPAGQETERHTCGPGEFIVVPPGSGHPVRIAAETPAECLALDPRLIAAGEGAEAAAAVPPPMPAAAAVDEQVAELVAAASVAEPAPAPSAPAAPAAAPARPGRPVPDPKAEPMLAVGAPIERRRETRLTVQLANGVVLLGLAGTRVAPVPGALVDLSASGMSARFRRGDLLQARGALRDAVVSVHLTLPGGEGAVRVASRVVWIDREPASNDPESALAVGLEFVAMGRSLQGQLERIVAAGAPATRK